ncbi:retrotransposon protein, putative, ty1-copia subclass [Tanacetum coccineum]
MNHMRSASRVYLGRWRPFSHQVERARDLLGLIHTDVCGPFRTMSREGASYFITFIDDFSRYGFVYLMKHKDEVFNTFKVFQNEVKNQLGKKIKAIQSDRGGEYLRHKFVNHTKSCGIVSQLTLPYAPQHNGVSERMNQTLLDMIRSIMNLTTLPKSFWGYALETTARILNMVPTKKVDRTPYEIWHGKSPKLSYLRVWGCEALVKRDTPDKLDSRSIKCIFVGYPKEMMGYYFYYPLENNIFVSRNVEFFENSFMVQEASGSHGLLKMSESDKGLELIKEEDTQPSENTSEGHTEIAPTEVKSQNVGVPIRRSVKIPQVPDRYGYYVGIEEYELEDLNEPPNYKVALADPESDKWLEAMNTEILKETFSPVADVRDIRNLLAIAAFNNYEIWQIDVKISFLNGHLSEDVYMVQPEGFVDPKHPNKVCKLQRSIYGLKQASRNLGEAAYILGIKIICDISKRLIALSQSAYLEKTLKKFKMENSKKRYIPMMEKPDYRKSQGAKTPIEVQRMQRVPYASAIGLIMYAVRCTRPDVAFAKNLCSRFQQNPREIYWTAVKTILKYLRNTKDMVLVYGAKLGDELKVSCYANASFQTDKDDTKSQTRYVFVLNGGAVD